MEEIISVCKQNLGKRPDVLVNNIQSHFNLPFRITMRRGLLPNDVVETMLILKQAFFRNSIPVRVSV